MQEELIFYGKTNSGITPLELWGFPISLYLFLGGLAAGIFIYTTLGYLFKKNTSLPKAHLISIHLAIVGLIIGSLALLFDLHKIDNVWRLFTHLDFQSPMSWGAWTLLLVIPLAIAWGTPYPFQFLRWHEWIYKLELFIDSYRKLLAVVLLLLSIILGIYTGMLLSALVARPLWNSQFLPLLFLVSGLSTGAVIIAWSDKNPLGRIASQKIDLWLIMVEILLIALYLGDLFSGSEAQVLAIRELIGGQFAYLFWVMVVLVGLVIPAYLEWRELKGEKIPAYVAPVLILIGGLSFRIIIVEAGQFIP